MFTTGTCAQDCISSIVRQEDLCFAFIVFVAAISLESPIQSHRLCLSFKSCQFSFNFALKTLEMFLDYLIKRVPASKCSIHVWSEGLAAREKGRFSHTTFYSSYPSQQRLSGFVELRSFKYIFRSVKYLFLMPIVHLRGD